MQEAMTNNIKLKILKHLIIFGHTVLLFSGIVLISDGDRYIEGFLSLWFYSFISFEISESNDPSKESEAGR